MSQQPETEMTAILAKQYEMAKMDAEKSLCILNDNRNNPRHVLRAVRALRKCSRLRNQILQTIQPNETITHAS